jgi:23S rRNA G2445 N2-methylase RlmL
MKYFATAVQGLGKILGEEILERIDGDAEVHATEFDGRNDIVSFTSHPADPRGLWISEDVYVEVSEATGESLDDIVESLFQTTALERALSVYASQVKPLRSRMSYRVVARLLSERSFMRSELRDCAIGRLRDLRSKWEVGDPGDLEFWVLETRPKFFRAGLRLTGPEMRHRSGRAVERPGSLKPTVAAAMVFVAGKAGGLPLIDPACGSGTILAEALSTGWSAVGSDIDPAAVEASRSNVPGAPTLVADARRLPFADGSFDAVLCNLPFGRQYRVPGSVVEWLMSALQEYGRVSREDSPIVLLVPGSKPFSQALKRLGFGVIDRYNLRVRGQTTALWEIDSSV